MRMRPATVHDVPGVYRVCHQTGRRTFNPDLLGHMYAGPYLANQGELAWVVVDSEGVAGYILGCRDTRQFERWCEQSWWPALREQYPLDPADPDADLVRLLHQPPQSPGALVTDYPAHLHIDLLPRTQGHGYGRKLIDQLSDALQRDGAPGVHLGVGADNTNAIEFYRHLGFVSEPNASTSTTLWMTRALT